MNLKKNLGRIATAFVATAMLASLTAVPASAVASATQGEVNKQLNELKINKVLTLPSDVATPTMHFDFTVEGDNTVAPDATVTLGKATLPLYAGAGTITTQGVDFTPAGDATNRESILDDENQETGKDKVTYEVAFTLPDASVFDAAGVYKYTINEVTENPALPDDYTEITADGLDLYLIVERTNANDAVSDADAYMITGAYIYPHDDNMQDTSTKTADYENWYKLDESGEKKVGDLNFKKEVKGAMANMSDTFTFTVTGAGIVNGTAYTVKIGENAEKTTKTATANGLVFEEVGNGADITIYGLDAGEYTITETDNETYKVTTTESDKDGKFDDANATLEVVKQTEVSTTFTNTRDSVSPTGIVMDVAPYALLVVVAAAGCFVFLRKRRED